MDCHAFTAQSFKCSRCNASFADLTRCKQHCHQPAGRCNRGRAREDFAKVVTVEVVFRESDRGFGGRRIRQDEGVCNHDDDQPGAGLDQDEQPETYLEGTQKIILLRYLNQS